MTKSYGVHWFRRDLRVAGNPGLQASWKKHEGRVVGVFCFDKKFLARPDFSQNRFAFFLETLVALKAEMQALGSDLLVLDTGPHESFTELLGAIKSHDLPMPTTFSFNRDYEPFARARDHEIERLLRGQFGLEVEHERDHLLLEPHEISKPDHSPYQVYTPFSKVWMKKFETEEVQARVKTQNKGLSYLKSCIEGEKVERKFKLSWSDIFKNKIEFKDVLETYRKKNQTGLKISLPPAGSVNALKHLSQFKGDRLAHYDTARDIPGIPGTSQVSIFLKNGSLTTSQIIAYLSLKPGKYLNELIWREFYYHILHHFPSVETETFQRKYAKIKWENDEKLFSAWCAGKTGYPLVDAGMRQLNETGWMHNRVRMVVASFLMKDCLIDYRWGEKYFMEKLLDGDLAPNNGGWQWAASTGCDAQPYFRIFNPVSQSERFDPAGDYIRKWVPELAHLSAKEIHKPWESSRLGQYVKPIVEHSVQSKRAIALFKSA